MGKELYDQYDVAKEVFERADAALGFKLSNMIFNGPSDELTLTYNAQPALLTVSIAAAKVLESMALNLIWLQD